MEAQVLSRTARRAQQAKQRRRRTASMLLTGVVVITCSAGFLMGAGANGSVIAGDAPEQIVSTVVPADVPTETPPEKTPEPVEEVVVELPYTEDEVVILCKTVYGEALVTNSDMEMSAVVWCILNRVDDASGQYPDTITGVVTKSQFHGYEADHPVTERIEWLVRDVLDRWVAERNGATDVGRTLPSEYLFFTGDGWHNHFRTEWQGGTRWDWSLPNPYES